MKAYRMIVKTETEQGKVNRETVRHIPEDQLDSRREAARASAPQGLTRTIRVVEEN